VRISISQKLKNKEIRKAKSRNFSPPDDPASYNPRLKMHPKADKFYP
jgi:hypothetical protein